MLYFYRFRRLLAAARQDLADQLAEAFTIVAAVGVDAGRIQDKTMGAPVAAGSGASSSNQAAGTVKVEPACDFFRVEQSDQAATPTKRSGGQQLVAKSSPAMPPRQDQPSAGEPRPTPRKAGGGSGSGSGSKRARGDADPGTAAAALARGRPKRNVVGETEKLRTVAAGGGADGGGRRARRLQTWAQLHASLCYHILMLPHSYS